MENNKPQIPRLETPRLETPQTAHIRASYPMIEYLEDGYVADWLKERKDQLLELAREERSGINANKLVSGAVLAAGFFFHALSPLAPVGVVLGIIGYVHGCFIDASATGSFSPFPFIRGNVLDLAGTLGNAELREKLNGDVDEFEQLQHYLSPVERKEYALIDKHFALLTDYITQIEPLKRFHAYRWIFDCFARFNGALPSPQQVNAHMANVKPDLRVDYTHLDALEQQRSYLDTRNRETRTIEQMNEYTPMPEVQVKFISDEQLRPNLPPTDSNAVEEIPIKITPIDEILPVEDKLTELVEFKTETPNLPRLLAQSLKLTLIVGVPGSGKGIFVTNALEAVKQYHSNTTIFYIDPKNDPKETAYFSRRVDRLFRKKLSTSSPEDAEEWVRNCLQEYDNFDCGLGRKLLVFDELSLTLKTLGAVKVEKGVESPLTWLKRKLSGYSTSGDSEGITLWGISQNAHVSGLGMDGGDRTMFVPIFIIDAQNVSASEGILKAQMIPGDKRLNSVEIQKLCKKSEIGRAVYFGGTNQWYPMPKLENYSGFDRDNRKFLPGFSPPPSTDKLASNYEAINRLEDSFKLDIDKTPELPEVEQVEQEQNTVSTSFDFNKGLEALRTFKGKDWIKFGDARANNRALRSVTRDADDVRLLVSFLHKDGDAEIKDDGFFRIINRDS
ncbi:hypothetical protein [Iningainema tapete]|uniref:Uncharacterized protein n=1 Tax=Iningainema tapete BLCC-T55 TaxID=2748662 RepID=A0A8J6XMZ1_9CYAN|nr:hypothetical protein [Iningainema tapete]MBD2773332.1 hypothetical protein [Iningainema tapete BLCC-T55]